MWRAILALILIGCAIACNDDIGGKYLGARYVNDPLGEGVAPDTDPLIRTDAFDCTTFVETALADGDVNRLTRIRYRDGTVGFENRNHFIETDWLTNNSDLERNVSGEYGNTALRHVVIDKSAWFRRVHHMDITVAPVTTDLEYIPYAELGNINNTEPLVVLFVVDDADMRDKIGTDLAVTHMGFLMPGGTLRHASSVAGHVIDTDFYEYVSARRQNSNNLGITLLEIKK